METKRWMRRANRGSALSEYPKNAKRRESEPQHLVILPSIFLFHPSLCSSHSTFANPRWKGNSPPQASTSSSHPFSALHNSSTARKPSSCHPSSGAAVEPNLDEEEEMDEASALCATSSAEDWIACEISPSNTARASPKDPSSAHRKPCVPCTRTMRRGSASNPSPAPNNARARARRLFAAGVKIGSVSIIASDGVDSGSPERARERRRVGGEPALLEGGVSMNELDADAADALEETGREEDEDADDGEEYGWLWRRRWDWPKEA